MLVHSCIFFTESMVRHDVGTLKFYAARAQRKVIQLEDLQTLQCASEKHFDTNFEEEASEEVIAAALAKKVKTSKEEIAAIIPVAKCRRFFF